MRAEEVPEAPRFDVCPAEGCESTEDLMVQECAPGHTWMYTGGICGHWAFVYAKSAITTHDQIKGEDSE